MTDAPERIHAWPHWQDGWARGYCGPAIDGDGPGAEYTRSDLIPTMLAAERAQAEAEGFRRGLEAAATVAGAFDRSGPVGCGDGFGTQVTRGVEPRTVAAAILALIGAADA